MQIENLLRELCASRPLPTDEFIYHCLYSPGGYYTRTNIAPGRHGDYFTSVSIGPQFGWLLAQHIVTLSRRLPFGENFYLIEQGAHYGTLANDILCALSQSAPELLQHIKLILIEPQQHLRTLQSTKPAIRSLPNPPLWLCSTADLPDGWTGFFYCNELLDAFPVKRFLRLDDRWLELAITAEMGTFFEIATQPAPEEALEALNRPPPPTENDIREWRPALAPWLRDIFDTCATGTLLLFDYGPKSAPVGDTVRAFHNHRQMTPWYARPGEYDITADVDFDHLASVGRGMSLNTHIQPQGRFLTKILAAAAEAGKLPSIFGSVQWSHWCRRFQTLAHPEHLGHRFQAFICEKLPAKSRETSSDFEFV